MMIGIIDTQAPETTEDQAAAWVVRMNAPSVEAHVERQFEMWISADARNALAYADMLATYGRAGDVAADAQRTPRRNQAAWLVGGAMLAACLVLGIVGLKGGLFWQSHSTQHMTTLATGPGETLDIPLPDGTRIALSGASTVNISYSSRERHIDLTRGEAYFDVAHDEQRPFTVTVRNTRVRVLGTAFNIDLLSGDESEISVYRGRVRVASDGQKRDLTVGEKVVSGADGLMLAQFDASEAPDWRAGWFDAEDTSLARLVDELNRYAKRPIRLDGAIGRMAVSGRFKISDPDLVISSLKTGYGLHSSVRNNVLVLTK